MNTGKTDGLMYPQFIIVQRIHITESLADEWKGKTKGGLEKHTTRDNN